MLPPKLKVGLAGAAVSVEAEVVVGAAVLPGLPNAKAFLTGAGAIVVLLPAGAEVVALEEPKLNVGFGAVFSAVDTF